MAQLVVENGQRSDPAFKGTVCSAAASTAARRVRLGPAARRRCRVDATSCAAVCRLVQLFLHHRHRDLADFEEIANRHLVGASSATGHALGRWRRVVRHPVRHDAVLPPLKVSHRQRVDRSGRPRHWLRRRLSGPDRIAAARGGYDLQYGRRCGRLTGSTASAAGAESATSTGTGVRVAAADVELSDEKVEEEFNDERRDVEQAVDAAAAE